MMIKVANSSYFKDWALVHDLGKEGVAETDFERPPLSEPLAFFGGHAYGAKTYTNGADRDQIVAPKFRDTTFELLGGVKERHFEGQREWGDAGVQALAVVLPLCAQLTELSLLGNAFGDAGLSAIAEACVEGGALAKLEVRSRFSPQDPVCASRHTRTTRCCARAPSLTLAACVCSDPWQVLMLGDNQIGDVGVSALARAAEGGALASLTSLGLEGVTVSAETKDAMDAAMAKGRVSW